jgi:glutamyl-tRNA synthetase
VRANGGILILRNEDLDSTRFKMKFVGAMLEDLRWFGFEWSEGPDIGGKFAPYNQSERMNFYRAALEKLRANRFIYPCVCSRKDIQSAVTAPHAEGDEPIYPGTCRTKFPSTNSNLPSAKFNWRFRVPDDEVVSFTDGNFGGQKFVAGKDIGDFVVWRHDDVPAYQLACVVDDAAMQITEVVRGADLLVSTARQILLYRALGLTPPEFFHCALMLDEKGERLAKRHDTLSLRKLRERGETPESLRRNFLITT